MFGRQLSALRRRFRGDRQALPPPSRDDAAEVVKAPPGAWRPRTAVFACLREPRESEVQHFSYDNMRKPTLFIIEPWCDEVLLQTHSTLDLIIEFPKIGPIETLVHENTFTIYLWDDCRARLFVDDVEITPPTLRKPM